MDARWYLDGWSVLDGLAFASLREAGSLESVASIFLCPPYFEPESMSNLATAKAAIRYSFQDGYCDDDGREIPFDTLEQIIEVVRLAYRAAGQGDPPVGTPLDEIPPPVAPEPDEGGDGVIEELERSVSEIWERFHRLALDPEGAEERSEIDAAARALVRAARRGLMPKFIGAVIERAFWSAGRLGTWSPDRVEALQAWIDAARRLAHQVEITPDAIEVDGFRWAGEQLSDEAREELRRLPFEVFWRAHGARGGRLGSLALPPRWNDLAPLRVSTIEQAILAIATDRLLLARQRPRGILPMITTTLLRCSAAHATALATPLADWRIHEAEQACAAWLVESLPSGALREHAAEREIALLQRATLGVRAEAIASAHKLGVGAARLEWEASYLARQRSEIASEMERLRALETVPVAGR